MRDSGRISREIRVLVGVLAGLVVFASLFTLDRAETYSPSNLLAGTWGQAEGQFGRVTGAGGRPYGPRSFTLDDRGNLYVADTFNLRIQKYDPAGRLSMIIPLVDPEGHRILGADDLAVDSRGDIWVADNRRGRLVVMGPDGHPKDVRDVFDEELKQGDAGFVRALWPGSGRGVYLRELLLTAERQVRRVRLLEEPSADFELIQTESLEKDGSTTAGAQGTLRTRADDFAPNPNGDRYYVVDRSGSGNPQVAVFTSKGRKLWEFSVQSEEHIRDLKVLGIDAEGDLYLGLNLGWASGEVRKYTGQGRLKGKWAVPGNGGPMVLSPGRVDSGGSIYVARTGPEGFQIEKLERSVRRYLRLRFLSSETREPAS